MRKLKSWRLLVLAVVIAVVMLVPAKASAAFSININLSKQESGAACGELWLGDELCWRLLILPDGVRPVLSGALPARTTFLTPAIVDGMFVINVK